MQQDIREIDNITFGIYSPEEIMKMAVCKIDNTKLNGDLGSVYDPRLGTIERDKICPTCENNYKECPGHFGYIPLNEHIMNPLFYKEIRDMLSFFCIKCYRLLLTKDQIKLNGMGKIKTRKALKDKKFEECSHCDHPQPDFKYSPNENTISMVYKQKSSNKISVILTVEEIKNIFNNVLDEDLELIGYDPKLVHPRNFILSVFPVIPTAARPWVVADGNYCDDDLTNQLIEIIKANNHLVKDDANMSETKRQKYLQSLKFRISTFTNNSQMKAKHSSGRPIKSLKERMSGN
jgi:DNA-directed RNA polymerase subunit A'